MSKVLINILGGDNSLRFNAADKARTDVNKTLVRLGYQETQIVYPSNLSKLHAIIKHLHEIGKAIPKIRRQRPEDIIIQYPGYRLGTRAIQLITRMLKKRHVTLLIHDIDSLRMFGQISKREISIMNSVSRLLVHTPAMKKYLQQNGVSTPMTILGCFDYYAEGECIINSCINSCASPDYSIVFAGNLKKSEFLYKIKETLSPHNLFLYGLPVEYEWPNGISYEGKFHPDQINGIKGDWGLVWDGDSLSTCTGQMGDYLKFNASHKASLYIASGKPQIVWNESALAEFIVQNNLGIAVSSLEEIPQRLKSITDAKYTEILQNIKKFQQLVRNGGMLEVALNSPPE